MRKETASVNSTVYLIGNSTLRFSSVKERHKSEKDTKKEKLKLLLGSEQKKTYVRIDKDIRTPNLCTKKNSQSRAAKFEKILDSLNQSHS